MPRLSLLSLLLLISTVFANPVPAEDTKSIGQVMPDFVLSDYLGRQYTLAELADEKITVVTFFGTECPVAKLYAGRLVELAEQYAGRVSFVGINSNVQDTPTEIGHFARLHKIEFPLLKDPAARIADQFGAERTPEAFVLDRQGVVRYHGCIDDQFGVGYARPDVRHGYLRQALDDLLSGRDVGVAFTEPVGCFIGKPIRREPTGSITYANHISRLIQRRCLECHREGGIAPFSLGSYEEAAAWGPTLVEIVDDERMPPWHANPAYGHFANDSRMPLEERELLSNWVANGAPEGDPAELPPSPEFVDGWRIGEPDLVIRMPDPIEVPPRGTVPYQYITVDTGLQEDRWVRVSEARPGARSVVHHILVFIQPPGAELRRDEDGEVSDEAIIDLEMLGGYVPGMPPMGLGPGTARLVPAGARLIFQMHYTPNGSIQADQSEIGLVFADPQEVKRTVQLGAAAHFELEIPALAESHRVTASTRFSHNTLLHALIPHMHYRGKSFRYTAIYPDGTREILLDVPRYDFNWQNTYRLATPKLMPEGTLLRCTAVFDNSENNPANPDPSAVVRWGEQTWQEMMIGYYEGVFVEQQLTSEGPRIVPVGPDQYDAHFSFRPDRPVRSVTLAGTFNDWNSQEHPLQADTDGVFRTTRRVSGGVHRYKFVIDGDFWTHDPASGKIVGFLRESYFVAEK